MFDCMDSEKKKHEKPCSGQASESKVVWSSVEGQSSVNE